MAKNKPNGNGVNLGFEEKLWQTADKLRNNMDALLTKLWMQSKETILP
jgi:hypothetical protein